MKAIEIQPPNEIIENGFIKIFLGGSIEQGKAIDWQKEIMETLKDESIIFMNPRRSDWNSDWKQSIDNPQFNEQVTWELKSLEQADFIVMFIDPTTLSPITLMEIGLHARSGKMVVCCAEGFWRKGNVDILGHIYGYPVVTTLEEVIQAVKEKLQ
jgi:nucleoside 2-deoxyribosyltransferase